jgi:choline kinase
MDLRYFCGKLIFSMTNPTLLVLAAGMGSRYKGLKQIDPIGPSGETILEYSVFDAIRAGFKKVVFVIRRSFEEAFKDQFFHKLDQRIEVAFCYQEIDHLPNSLEVISKREKPWGTGHAVWVAKDEIQGPFAIINADDYYGPSSFREVYHHFDETANIPEKQYCMVGYRLGQTLSEHGYVSRGLCQTDSFDHLISVEEKTCIELNEGKIISTTEDQHEILNEKELVSMNFWGLPASVFSYVQNLFVAFYAENRNDLKAEFYIPFVINKLIQENGVKLKVLQSQDQWFGVTYQQDKDLVVNKVSQLIQEGVYPENLWD